MKNIQIGLLILFGITSLGARPQDSKKVRELEKRVVELETRLAQIEAVLQKMLTQGLPRVQGAIERSIQRAKITSCANNLGQLWKMQNIYMSQFGGRLKSMPKETGSAFWLALTRTKPPLIGKENFDIFVCPASGKQTVAGFTSYRGPAKQVNELEASAPVGCCEPGCHPDGTINVLLKTGDVQTVGPTNPLYKKALEGTKGASQKR